VEMSQKSKEYIVDTWRLWSAFIKASIWTIGIYGVSFLEEVIAIRTSHESTIYVWTWILVRIDEIDVALLSGSTLHPVVCFRYR